MSMPTLSIIILARNEADNIADCIHSCAFADEILVIDDSSTDETVALAKAASPKVKVFEHALNGDYAQQRNFGIECACGDWILFIDADERITDELRHDIISKLTQNKARAYRLQRLNVLEGQIIRHGPLRSDRVTRLFPKNKGFFTRKVHERLETELTKENLSGHLLHLTYPTWESYWIKFERYTAISAQSYFDEGKHVNFFSDILLRPFWAFLKMYIFNLGFLDGKMGWVLAVNYSIYTMTKYVRLWSLRNKHQR